VIVLVTVRGVVDQLALCLLEAFALALARFGERAVRLATCVALLRADLASDRRRLGGGQFGLMLFSFS
jgi:hypothetical protein